MSRVPTDNVVVVKPTNNVYTALVVIGCLANVLAFVVLFLRAADIFTGDAKSLFG